MAAITIRNLDDEIKIRLRLQAAQHGCSMEQEVREILTVPFSMRVVLILLVGQAAEVPEPAPRKGIRQISGRDHW